MTPEEQAEAILKAQEIVELDFQIFALDDLYADYHRQYENRETGRSFLASALLEKHKALEAAEKELATTIATARTSALKEAAVALKPLTEFWRLETMHGETIGHEDLNDAELVSINTSGGLSVIVGTVADLRPAAILAIAEVK